MIRIVVLAILLVVQTAVWLVMDPPWREVPQGTEMLEEKGLDGLDVASVARLQIVSPAGRELVLVRGDEGWVVETEKGFPAVDERVERALERVADLEAAEFRSDKAMMHETYEVDERRAQRLAFFDAQGRELLVLHVGKRDVQGAQGTFVRRAGEDDVYVARAQDLGQAFSAEPRAWYETLLMDVDARDPARANELKSQAYRIEVDAREGGEQGAPRFVRHVYEKRAAEAPGAAPVWRVVEPEGSDLLLDDLLVKNMVGNLLAVRAERIVGPGARPEYGLDDPESLAGRVVIRFRAADGRETTRSIDFGEPVEPGTAPGGVALRHARIARPDSGRIEDFVFGVPAVLLDVFARGPGPLAADRTGASGD